MQLGELIREACDRNTDPDGNYDDTFCLLNYVLGADINKADNYGRTPLHVAAFADYPEMVRFLIENGADFHVTTRGELQTPLHFAARNEASQCVKILLAHGATLEARDYKQRTPLQVR